MRDDPSVLHADRPRARALQCVLTTLCHHLLVTLTNNSLAVAGIVENKAFTLMEIDRSRQIQMLISNKNYHWRLLNVSLSLSRSGRGSMPVRLLVYLSVCLQESPKEKLMPYLH